MAGHLSYPRPIEHWGYPYGLMAYWKENSPLLCDLYGPFLTYDEAAAKIGVLVGEHWSYDQYIIVRIETPVADRPEEKEVDW